MVILEVFEHVVSHSIADTLYLIPFLFATYVAMEWLEHMTGSRTQDAIKRAGAAGPAVGAIAGVVPQCGFSAAAATLYAGRVITLGTLFAVFLSTSDEMLPIFIAEQAPVSTILTILGAKVVIGMVAGFLIDAVIRVADRYERPYEIHRLCRDADCGCHGDCEMCEDNPELVYEHNDDAVGSSRRQRAHDHSHDHEFGWSKIFKSALVHTLKITLFVFVVTIILNIVLETVGEEALASAIGGDSLGSVALSGLVGLIPNCAASIVIAQLYLEGVLGAGSMLAGLLVSAGIGLLVLCRTNRHAMQNIAIIVGLYAIGLCCGLIVALLGITF